MGVSVSYDTMFLVIIMWLAHFLGAPCVAQYTNDGLWYRAEIIDIIIGSGEDKIAVRFVDYGNFDYVSRTRLVFI